MIDRLSCNVYQRGVAGVPTTTLLARLAPDTYEHTIANRFGFESATITFGATRADALDWLQQLMSSLQVDGPDADRVWEGFLTRAEVRIGQVQHSRSLEKMANRMRVRYTTVNGVAGVSSTASALTSQYLYGIRDDVVTLNTATSTAAGNLRDAELAARQWPVSETSIASGPPVDGAAAQVTLTFAGWYDTLGWVLTSRTDTTTESTTAQVIALLGSSPGISSTNQFISQSSRRIAASGVNATRKIDDDTTYRTKMEALLQQGNGTGQNVAWGVYEDRVFVVEGWAGNTPSTVAYTYDLDWQTVYDANLGGAIWPWQVRPNKMVLIPGLLDVAPPSGAPDAAGRLCADRVTCRVSRTDATVQIEPSQTDALEARLTQLAT